jgi:C-terminal processing protease CtpA/Prc
VIEKNTFNSQYNLEEYGINLINEENKIIVDTIKWNGNAKKSGIEMGDYITEFKTENSNRPNKKIVYPFAFLLLLLFGYLNKKRIN